MPQYKDHPIYGIGVRGAGEEWHCRGLIFSSEDKVTEVKKLERAELTFETEEKAKAYALQLCKTWIDEQSGDIDSKGLASKDSLKNLLPVIG